MGEGRSNSAILSDVLKAKTWVRDEMEADIWISITNRQIDTFKWLIAEQYGWPEFTLNLNRTNTKIMKIMVW